MRECVREKERERLSVYKRPNRFGLMGTVAPLSNSTTNVALIRNNDNLDNDTNSGNSNMKIFAIFFLVAATFAGMSESSAAEDPLLAQLDLQSLRAAAAQLPLLLGDVGGVAEADNVDNADHILAAIEKEITEAILNVVSEDDDDLTSVEEMDKLITSLENEKDLEAIAGQGSSGGRPKRLTVEFMGMQVRKVFWLAA